MSTLTPQCWVCDNRHDPGEFPLYAGVRVTYGGMAGQCLRIYESMPRHKRDRIRRDGVARFEEREAARAGR